MAIDLSDVQRSIARQGLRWQAHETSNTGHSEEDARRRLGAVPPVGMSLGDREVAARSRVDLGARARVDVSTAWDWRDVEGSSYVTPIKDQAGCGSCVAFGTIAAFEAQTQIAFHGPALGVELSEAHLWFCYGQTHGAGACPDGGWWPDAAFPGLIDGIVPASSFPYTDSDQPCNLPQDWKQKLTKTTNWQRPGSLDEMKLFLAQRGPMTACFTIYEDFYYYYRGGVYQYNSDTSGNVIGGHCICIVGYDDDEEYWIAKNSWGTGWGEAGYFRIGYGDCGIDAEMWGVSGKITSAVWQDTRAEIDPALT
jgi:C1A family cysteine protease